MIPKHHHALFANADFPAQGLSAMLVSPGKGKVSCRHHRFARALARCHWAYSTGQSVTNLFAGPHIVSFDWARLPSNYMTAVTSSWPTRNDWLHRGCHCILVMWYYKNWKYLCFLWVTFMFLPRMMHFIFIWYCRGGNKSLYQLLKIIDCFPDRT